MSIASGADAECAVQVQLQVHFDNDDATWALSAPVTTNSEGG